MPVGLPVHHSWIQTRRENPCEATLTFSACSTYKCTTGSDSELCKVCHNLVSKQDCLYLENTRPGMAKILAVKRRLSLTGACERSYMTERVLREDCLCEWIKTFSDFMIKAEEALIDLKVAAFSWKLLEGRNSACHFFRARDTHYVFCCTGTFVDWKKSGLKIGSTNSSSVKFILAALHGAPTL